MRTLDDGADRSTEPGPPCWRRCLLAATAFAWLACCPPVWGNIIDPDAPPLSELFQRGIGRGVGWLLFPFMLTIIVEAPVVMFVLRKSLPLGASALVSFVVGVLSYPLAFYLVFHRDWDLLPMEGLVAAVEFLLFVAATWILDRLDVVREDPTGPRLLAASVAANQVSTGVMFVFFA